jgi:hypothetical protein
VPGGRSNLHGPLWIALLIGIAVFFAGIRALMQDIDRANAGGGLHGACHARVMGARGPTFGN